LTLPLRLQFADKYRLWAELVRARSDRLFIACPIAGISLGARLPLQMDVGEVPLMATVDVVGMRKAGTRFAEGVWVHIDDDQADTVRRFLGLKSTDRPPAGRLSVRIPCQLEVRLRRPEPTGRTLARNLSDTGLLLEAENTELHAGQYLEFDLSLDDGQRLGLKAEVHRVDGQEGWGLRFLDAPEPALTALRAQVDRLIEATPTSAPRIVVGDDDPNILEFLSRALQRHHIEVARARNGDEALGLVRALRPGLVLLDILMPGIDGADICRAMRADVELVHIPVVFLSSLEPERLHQVADEAGANDYLQKPVGLSELLNLVGMYLKP
jgi:CheY-like chemotaxis protein